MAAARELFEETGLDYRDSQQLKQLRPLGELAPGRYYFQLILPREVTRWYLQSFALTVMIGLQQPVLSPGVKGSKLASANTGEVFQLLLSKEHVSFVFEKDALVVILLLRVALAVI